MDRRKFIQTGVAGVAGLSLAHTGRKAGTISPTRPDSGWMIL